MSMSDVAGRPAMLGALLVMVGLFFYLLGIALSLVRLILGSPEQMVETVSALLWYSGAPTSLGLVLIAIDLFALLPRKRSYPRLLEPDGPPPSRLAVALMCYNDVDSIGDAVQDFRDNPLVSKVIVVDNNSSDGSREVAEARGAIVVKESRPGYGMCAYRCLEELYSQSEDSHVVLCEGDRTFRSRDIQKLAVFAQHGDLVNGTRIVEQLRSFDTQLSTFMYYGNFFVGKLLELKHLGRGTFTDVGTTYKLLRRDMIPDLLAVLNPNINLQFNAHLMDRALARGFSLIECPITFHARVGVSKGGNVNNGRALRVGLGMIAGLLTDWATWKGTANDVSVDR